MTPSRLTRTLLLAGVSLALLTGALHAVSPVPANLGNGLDKLVASQRAVAAARLQGPLPDSVVGFNGTKYIDQRTANFARLGIIDDQKRVLVRVTLNGTASFKNTRKGMKASAASLSITAVDKKYRGVGIMNAWVDVADVSALARVPGVAAVILEMRPIHRKLNLDQALSGTASFATAGVVYNKLGTDFDQGVIQHRVDQINRYYNPGATLDFEGSGIQIGCISNSFDAHTAKPASTDVTRFDLPGSSSNPVNTTPVFVLQDDLSDSSSDDEGRGMCQIAYKMAPKAAVAFATADFGEVGFANNIRGLAGIAGYTVSGQTFAADTICDDVSYSDEPFFQDGIIADGVDDASAAGVAYFSSAGNDIGTSGYDSPLRFVANGSGLTAATNSALVGTNINLASVPTNLYAGGFHNFNPDGLDVAQTLNDPNSNTSVPTVLQWNEPYDQNTQPVNPVNIYHSSGNFTTAPVVFTVPNVLTAGDHYEFVEAANGDGFDAIVTITDPNGNVVAGPQDTGVDETINFTAPVTGANYKFTVDHFDTTTGAFTVDLYSTGGFAGNIVQTQIYLLCFDINGNYLPDSSGTSDALSTNQPIQFALSTPTDTTQNQVQILITRGNAPTGPGVATRVRYLLPGDGAPNLGPAEYFRYGTVTTGGHAMASTCNGCAAMSVFRPSLPEYFSSPGPATIYFDKSNNILSTPEVRLQPHIAACDGGNVSSNMNGYFAADDTEDPDFNGNFYGTSAAGPHAAAIAALALQANGGRHSLTPAQMTSLPERSTFPHDLDPNFASGGAKVTGGSTAGIGKVTVTISSDNSTNAGVGENDPNAFTVSYIGGSSVTSIVFNPGGTAATAGNVSGGNNGVTYANPPGVTTAVNITPGGTATYFENSLPGVAFLPVTDVPFTLGTGITGATAAFSNPSSSLGTEYFTMAVTVPTGNLSGGKVLRFGVGRGVARTADTGPTTVTNSTSAGGYYTADIFGGGVTVPSGSVVTAGMTFSGTTADGGTFSGVIKNNIGAGYSVLDGFGFIDAQAAVGQTAQ